MLLCLSIYVFFEHMVMKITECCFFESSYSTFGSYGMLAGKGVKVKHLID